MGAPTPCQPRNLTIPGTHPGSPVVHGGTLRVFCGLLVTGLSFTDAILVSKKIYQITRESEAKLKTQGDTPPDDKAVSKAQLRRDSSNNLIQVNPKEPVTQQVRYVARKQLFLRLVIPSRL